MNYVDDLNTDEKVPNIRCWGNRNDPLIMSILGEPREHDTNNGENQD